MPCCCTRVLNLCSVPVCGVLTFGNAPEGEVPKDFKLVLDFLQTTVTINQVSISPTDPFEFDISMLNENFEYTGQVFNEDGDVVPIVIGEDSYDCIKFKTKINVLLEFA